MPTAFPGVTAIALMIAVLVGTAAKAGTKEDFDDLLETGRTHEAIQLASNWLQDDGSQEARFALGTAQFLFAVERLGHGFYTLGLGNADYEGMWIELLGLPFLRFPVPPNPEAQAMTYEDLRDVLRRFGEDLSVADRTLADVGPEEFDFPLHLDRIALDFNDDGAVAWSEHLDALFSAVSPMSPQAERFRFDFDQSDAPWLRAYTHLLRAMTEFLLAHDWSETFDETFHFVFPQARVKTSELRNSAQLARDYMERHDPPKTYWEATRSYSWNDPNRPSREAWMLSPEGLEWTEWDREFGAEYRRADALLSYGGIADVIAFIHRFEWPVVDEARMKNARIHLLQMIELSRENWRRIFLETDDNYEWLPSPGQTPRFARMRVSDEVVQGWFGFLDVAEDVLEGRKLIAHWRFIGKGVNVRKMFETPGTFDLVMIIQGAAVIDYLEEGETVSAENAQTMIDIFDQGFLAYFIWFN